MDYGVATFWSSRFPGLREMTLDLENDEFIVVTSDRGTFRQQDARSVLSSESPPDFKRVTYQVAEDLLVMVTQWDEVLETEVFLADNQHARRADRPVVYLDQNKWVQVAQAIHAPERVHPGELDATRAVVELAETKSIILPVSSGHWIETGPVYGARRERLASSMVRLSRGWIMRDPLGVRTLELVALFANRGTQRALPEYPGTEY